MVTDKKYCTIIRLLMSNIGMKFIFYLLFSLVSVSSFYAQYKTNKLEEIAKQIQLETNSNRLEGLHSVQSWRGYPIVICVDGEHIVDHIGLRLFNRNVARDKDMTIIFDFVERYLLELILVNNKEQIATLLRDDKVVLEYGDFSDLKLISDSSLLEITQSDTRTYHISWINDKNKKTIYSLSFPIQYDLILGMNKIEIENKLADEVRSHAYNVKVADMVRKEDLLPAPQANYYIKQGNKYILEALNSNLYYKKDAKKGFHLLLDENHPIESLANLMISDNIENNYQIEITQNKYGQQIERFSVPLKQWIRYCIDSGCVAYFGVESQSENEIKASVVMENRKLAYNHVFYLSFDKALLRKPNDTIRGKLHAYIPTHNVTDLFYSSKAKKTQNVKSK